MHDKIFIEQLEAKCRIGIYAWERKILQKITVDLEFPADIQKAARRDKIEATVDYKSIAKFTLKFIAESEYFLIETLAENLASTLLRNFHLKKIRLRLSKPGAIRHSKNVGLEIVRFKKN